MPHIMTKRGTHDNVVTYEHICDTIADRDKIDPQYITLGTVAIVLKGSAGLEVYMADSNKEWVSLVIGASGDNSNNETIIILPETEVTFTYDSGWNLYYGEIDMANFQDEISNGDRLRITFDDGESVVTAHDITEQEVNVIGYRDVIFIGGNVSLNNDDTVSINPNTPFIILCDNVTGYCDVYTPNEGPHTFTIERIPENTNPK